jgi:putative phosphoribosyl transferase
MPLRRSEAVASEQDTPTALIQPHFRNRSEAGDRLAVQLRGVLGARSPAEILVLALPLGGVPVAARVAAAFSAPLDIVMVQPLPVPADAGIAMGAVASGGVRMLNETIIRAHGVSDEVVARVAKEEQRALARTEALLRGTHSPPRIEGRTVVLVTDGAATGANIAAAAAAVRTHDPERIIAALPVASPEALRLLRGTADEVVCAWTPDPFVSTAIWYEDFADVSESEVRRILEGAA